MDKLILYSFITNTILIIKMISFKDEKDFTINSLIVFINLIVCLLIAIYGLK